MIVRMIFMIITHETYLNEGIFEIKIEGQFSSSVTNEYYGFDNRVITYDRWTDDMSNNLWTYADYTNISSYEICHKFFLCS